MDEVFRDLDGRIKAMEGAVLRLRGRERNAEGVGADLEWGTEEGSDGDPPIAAERQEKGSP